MTFEEEVLYLYLRCCSRPFAVRRLCLAFARSLSDHRIFTDNPVHYLQLVRGVGSSILLLRPWLRLVGVLRLMRLYLKERGGSSILLLRPWLGLGGVLRLMRLYLKERGGSCCWGS